MDRAQESAGIAHVFDHIAEDAYAIPSGFGCDDVDFALENATGSFERGTRAFAGERRILDAGYVKTAPRRLPEKIPGAATDFEQLGPRCHARACEQVEIVVGGGAFRPGDNRLGLG